jgi:hypothetical protein
MRARPMFAADQVMLRDSPAAHTSPPFGLETVTDWVLLVGIE